MGSDMYCGRQMTVEDHCAVNDQRTGSSLAMLHACVACMPLVMLLVHEQDLSKSHLCAVIRGMTDAPKVGCAELGHADELHVVLHCIVGSKQVPISGQCAHCGLAEGIQSCKESPDNLQMDRLLSADGGRDSF